jgi:hypothetical protein
MKLSLFHIPHIIVVGSVGVLGYRFAGPDSSTKWVWAMLGLFIGYMVIVCIRFVHLVIGYRDGVPPCIVCGEREKWSVMHDATGIHVSCQSCGAKYCRHILRYDWIDHGRPVLVGYFSALMPWMCRSTVSSASPSGESAPP